MPTLLPNVCPHCHFPLAGEVQELDSNEKPVPGDFLICGLCGNPCVYTDKMTLRVATQAEFHETVKTLEAFQERLDASGKRAYEIDMKMRNNKRLGPS